MRLKVGLGHPSQGDAPAPGGAPIGRGDVPLGAIGASGGTGAQDHAVITRALEAIEVELLTD